MVVPHPKFPDFLKFDNLTFAPYCRELIDKSLLAQEDIDFINNFHKDCFDKVSPLLKDNKLGYDYLKRQTQPL